MEVRRTANLSFILFAIGAFGALELMGPISARAGYFEASIGGGYNRSDFGNNNYNWSRRWGASLAYHFTERSSLEFGFQDVTDRTYISGYEDTTFHDRVYGLNIVQSFTPKEWPVQPYVKAGLGLLNREASGTYVGGGAPPAIYDAITGIIGLGLRIYLTKTFAIRAEGTSYLTGGMLKTWQDNISVNFGLSVYF